MTIDMKTFAGGSSDTDAVYPSVNTYQTEIAPDDVIVDQGIMDGLLEDKATQVELAKPTPLDSQPEAPSKQELNFEALRGEIAQIKAERDEIRQNLDLLRSNLQQQQAPVQREAPKKFLEGMEDHDVPNVQEIRKAFEQREQEYQMRLEEIQVQQNHPDYAEVLEKFTGPLLKQKPHLAEGIYGASNKALFAYELGKMAQGMQQTAHPPPLPEVATPPNVNAQRIVENAKKPGSIAQAGGQSVLSKADYFATMSDAEFMKMASKNLGEI